MNHDCVFCDRTKLAERLVGENDDWYVVATLGQIIGGYTLVIPKAHVPCIGALTGSQAKAMLKITKGVCRALALEYRRSSSAAPYPVTMFEHGIVGQTVKHAHLHILPAVIDLTPKLRVDFSGAEFEELSHAAQLQELYAKRLEPYLYWTVPAGKSMVCWNPPASPQYLRLVIAELLGCADRGNWRNMDPELDKQLGLETVNRLKSYFP